MKISTIVRCIKEYVDKVYPEGHQYTPLECMLLQYVMNQEPSKDFQLTKYDLQQSRQELKDFLKGTNVLTDVTICELNTMRREKRDEELEVLRAEYREKAQAICDKYPGV